MPGIYKTLSLSLHPNVVAALARCGDRRGVSAARVASEVVTAWSRQGNAREDLASLSTEIDRASTAASTAANELRRAAIAIRRRAARADDRDGSAPIRWKRSTGDYVESRDGSWSITPIYGGCTRPERYNLSRRDANGWRVVGGGSTQGECKEDAERIRERYVSTMTR